MANSATVQTGLNIEVPGIVVDGKVKPVLVNYDTTGADLEIMDVTASDRAIALVGMQLVEGDAFDLTFKSDSTVITTMQLGSNSGFSKNIDGTIILSSAPGEALNINCDTALTPFVLYVVEYARIRFTQGTGLNG